MSCFVSEIHKHDAIVQDKQESAATGVRTIQDNGSAAGNTNDRVTITWEENDKENPYNWHSVRSSV